MATEQQILSFLQTPGLSDQQIAAEMNRIGATPQQISNVTGVPAAEIQSRIAAAAPAAAPSITALPGLLASATNLPAGVTGGSTRPAIEQQIFNYLQTPGLTDAQIAAEMSRIGATAQQISNVTGVPVGQINTRTQTANYTPAEMGFFNFLQTPGLTDAQIAAEANRLGILPQQVSNITGVPLADAQNRFFTEFMRTPGLTDAQIAAEMARLGISQQQVSKITGVPVRDVTNRANTALPFANVNVPSNLGAYTPPPAGSMTPQTFEQNFNNYMSIPIGAQYNPNVTAGGASPYSQIRPQMQPVGNPYAGFVGGQFAGGYDPTIYDANLLNNFVQQRADKAVADAAAAQQTAIDYGGFNGGLITRVMGPKPSTPDDGTMFVQKGEYIVKKDSVDKYGKGLLDKINDGKVPAKKIKSLLD